MRAIPLLLAIPLVLDYSLPNRPSEVQALHLEVVWNLETNFADGGGHRARFLVRNTDSITLTADNWELYWSMSPRSIRPESITAPVTIEWINGDFYVMKPTAGFTLPPGSQLEVAYSGSYAVIKESDAPLGLYSVLYAEDGSYELVPVREYSIAPFERPEQINRHAGDREPIPTAAWLFDTQSIMSALPEDRLGVILPTPRSVIRGEGQFQITATTAVSYDPGLQSEATLLAGFLSDLLDRPIPVSESGAAQRNTIRLQLTEVTTAGAYRLTVSPRDGVVIAGDRSGVFYGTQSLKALIPAERLGRKSGAIAVPTVRVEDAPAFGYRGMHLDVGRNFHSVTSVKRLLDAMAFYKLNTLHLNLTEDEGWRIEIEELPELTRVGAFRGHPTDAGAHLQPSYGSGPFPDPATGYGSGFYSRQEYIDLVRYAGERHIEIIPEVNVPGHARAAIKAMEYRYHRLMEEGRAAEAEQYRLVDPNDASKYRSAQWYTDNVISVCRESAFRFLTTVIDDLIEMHDEAGVPLTTFHTGGDEVPQGAWSASPLCAEYMERHPEIDNPRNLQKDYFRRIDAYLDAKGLRTAGWEEIAMNFREDGSWTPNDEFANSNVIPYIWNSLWGAEDLGNRLANAGYPVVLCNVTNFYFDLAYTKDPREPGLYWGGFVNTRDAFEFVPYDVFKSIKTTPDGEPYTDADFAGKEVLTVEGRGRILGLQGQLWSETLKGQGMLEYYYLPKMLGLAERAWHGQADWGSIADREERNRAVDAAWNVFANTVGRRELPRLDRLNGGYNYRLAPPGARVENGRVVANVAYPGLVIRYTTDGSHPTPESPRYTRPVEITFDVITLSTFDSRGRSGLPTMLDVRAR